MEWIRYPFAFFQAFLIVGDDREPNVTVQQLEQMHEFRVRTADMRRPAKDKDSGPRRFHVRLFAVKEYWRQTLSQNFLNLFLLFGLCGDR